MKVAEYNQMMAYLTRPSKSTSPTQVEKDLSQKQLEKYATQPDSTGAYKAFKKQRAMEDKIDEEIINFGKNFQPHKNKINSKYDPDEWLKHNVAMYEGDGSKKFEKDLIEDVQLQSNGEMRGMLTEKIYNAKDAITMNEKYDRNFTNPNLTGNKQTYLTANEKVLANFNPTEALQYTNGGKDKENVQYMRYVKAKAKRINGAALTQTKLADSKILKNNINNKKIGKVATTDRQQEEADRLWQIEQKKMELDPDYIPKLVDPEDLKVALLTDEQKKDPKIIEVPFGPSFKEIMKEYEEEKKENKDESYKIKLPRDPLETRFKAMVLQNELEKERDASGGIANFLPRVNLAGGGNGSTPKTPQTYQKQIEDLYGIQLTGQETIAELLEMVKELNEKN